MPPLNRMTPSYPHRHDPNLAEEAGFFPGRSTGPPPAIALPSSGPADKPQSPAAPHSDIEQTLLQPRPEDFGHSGTTESAAPNQDTTGANGEFMRTTMTVVKQAPGSRDEPTDHETCHDADADADGQNWHMSARHNISEKAKAIEKLRDAAEGPGLRRPIVPPIDVELNYDSADEGDGRTGGLSSNSRRQNPHITEDIASPYGHVDLNRSYSPSIQSSERFIVPSPVSSTPYPESEIDDGDAGVATATFPQNEQARTPENNSSLPSRVSLHSIRGISNGISDSDVPNYSFLELPAFPSKSQEGVGGPPSPAASWNGHRHRHSISSARSSTLVATSPSLFTTRSADLSANRKSRSVDPVEWTVEEVTDWLRSKGFDEVVVDMFTEQEITGDVLSALDSATLKSEFGTIPLGKRIRIARAITDLFHLPSIQPSSAEQHTGPGSHSQASPLAPQDTSMVQGSPNRFVSPKVPPDTEDLMHPSVPVYPGADPGVRLDATEFYSRETSTKSNGGVRSVAGSPYSRDMSTMSNGGVCSVGSPYSRDTSALSNGGVRSIASSPYSRDASAMSNGGVRSVANSPYSMDTSAMSNRGVRSDAITSYSRKISSSSKEGVWSNALNVTKNLGTKISGFLFSPPNSSSSTSKLPSSHVSKKATRLFARQRR